ncbi:MAG: transcription antitermination protein NusB [Bacteroidaceae bacterium]
MINRELIRLKVVQLVYAYYQNEDKSIEAAEKELSFSMSKAYDLYQYMLLLIVELTNSGKRRLEIQRNRQQRMGMDEESSSRFSENRFAAQLAMNKTLLEFCEKQKKTWIGEEAFVKSLFKNLIASATYGKYMVSDDDSYAADREFWRKAYKEFICNNDELDQILEEQSLYWNDDKDIIDSFVLKTIKRFDEKNGEDQPLLPAFDSEDDNEFAILLFRQTLSNGNVYRDFIRTHTKNWEFKRLAMMDVVIMQTALAEIINFPGIPLNVSFNEYLDIAKVYSTPKSPSYINGMLDNIVKQLKEDSKILK